MSRVLQPSITSLLLKQQQQQFGVPVHQVRHFTAYSSLRNQNNTTTASSSTIPTPDSQVPPHRRSTGPPSKHKLFYRDIVPPLFRVLAYGSAVFLSLQLVWQYLDGHEQKKLEEQVRIEMEAQVRQKLENKGVVKGDNGKSWWSWLGM